MKAFGNCSGREGKGKESYGLEGNLLNRRWSYVFFSFLSNLQWKEINVKEESQNISFFMFC